MNHGKRVKLFRTISALSLLVASAGVSRVLLAVEGENGVSIDKSLLTQKSGGISRKNDTYFIKSETYGKTAGKNVFFSFDKFAIGSKETALFYCDSCPDARNVISRLTGAEKATINGTVRSGIGRNFYLLSPNGMVFGENAVIDVPGVTHLSTAGSLEFGNGSFQADQSRQKENVSTLTGDPRQFGFLSDKALQVNSLNVVNGGLDLAANQLELSGTLSVLPTAGDLQIVGNRIIVTGLVDSQSKRGDIRILAANTSLANPATHDDPLNSDIGRITLNEGGVLQASNGGTLIMGSGTIPSVGRDGKSSIDWPGFTAFSQHEPDNAFSVRSFESGLISLAGGGSVVLNNGIDNPNQANLLAANTLVLDSGFILDSSSNPLTLESRVRDVSLYGQTQIRKTAGSELLLKSARSVQILDKAELLHDSANSNTLIASIDGTLVNGSVRTPGGILMVEGGIDRFDTESYSGTMTAGTGVEVSGLLKTGDLVTNEGEVTITGTGTIHAERTVRSESGNLTIARAGVLQSPLLAANNHVVISGTGSTDKTLARQGTVTIAKGGTLTAQESVTAEQADITAAGTLTTGELLAARNLDVSGTATVEKSTTTEQGNVTVSGRLTTPELKVPQGKVEISDNGTITSETLRVTANGGVWVNGLLEATEGALSVTGKPDLPSETYTDQSGQAKATGGDISIEGFISVGSLLASNKNMAISGTAIASSSASADQGNVTVSGLLQSPKVITKKGDITIAKGGTLTARESVTAEQADITAAGTLTTGELLAARNLDVSGTATVEASTTTEQGNVTVSGRLTTPELKVPQGKVEISDNGTITSKTLRVTANGGVWVNGLLEATEGALSVTGKSDLPSETYTDQSGQAKATDGDISIEGFISVGSLLASNKNMAISGTAIASSSATADQGNVTVSGLLQSPKVISKKGDITIAKGGTLTAQESVTAEQADITAAGTLTTGELLAARNLDVSGTTTVEKSTTTEQGNVTVSGLLQSPEVTAKTGNINIAGTLKTKELNTNNLSIDKGLLTNAIPNEETGVTIQAEKITLESIKVSDKLPQSFDDAKQYGGMYFDNAGTVTIISDNIEGKQIKEESKDSPLNGNRAYIFSFNDKDIFFSNKTKITQPGQSDLIISNSSIWKGKNKEENSGDIIFGDDKNKTNKVSLLDTHVLNYGRGENSSNNNVLFKLTGTTPEIIMGHSVVETRTDPEGQGGLINVSVPVETNYIYKDRTGQKTGRGGWIAAEPDSDLLDFYTRRSDYSNPASTLSLFASREYDKIDIAITSRTPSLQATGLSVIAPAPVKIDLDDVSSNPCDKAGSSLSWHGLGQYTPEQTLILPSQSSAQAINTVNHSEDNHSSIMSAYRLTQDTLWQASDAINLSTSQLEDAASKLQATSNDCDQHANLFN